MYKKIVWFNKKSKKTTPLNIQLVIASYHEELTDFVPSLLENYPVVIYNTLDRQFNEFPVINISNLAREASQWLYHIIHNYYNLADYTLFLQGDLGYSIVTREWIGSLKIKPECVTYTKNWLKLLSSVQPFDFIPFSTSLPLSSCFKVSYRKFTQKEYATMHYYLSSFTSKDFPAKTLVTPAGGQFVASRKFIQLKPIEYYRYLYYRCEQDRDKLAHFGEYIWPSLLDYSKNIWP